MYPKFIEVHEGGDPFSVNVDRIVWIYNGTIKTEENIFNVDESYEMVKQLISDAGCLIHKADPRLDNKPLTIEQLGHMIGEPVWNSNTRLWYLVRKADKEKNYVELCWSNGYKATMTAADLIKYPLYRMKVTE